MAFRTGAPIGVYGANPRNQGSAERILKRHNAARKLSNAGFSHITAELVTTTA